MGIDATDRQGQAICEFALDTQGSLLGIRILIVGLAAENYTQRRGWAGVCHADAELSQISRRNASGIARCWGCTLNLALRKQRLENARGCKGRGASRNARECRVYLGNLPETIDIARGLNYFGNLATDLRVKDPE